MATTPELPVPPAGEAPEGGRPRPIHLAAWIAYFSAWAALSILPFVGQWLGGNEVDLRPGILDDRNVIAFGIASSWVSFAVAALLAWRSGLTRADLGLTALPARKVIFWTGLTLTLLLGFWVALETTVGPYLEVVEPITRAPQGAGHWLLWLALAATAGITEEFVVRAYGIGFLRRCGMNRWVAAGFTSLLFGAFHLYQGMHAALILGVWGFLFAVPFLRTGNLLPGILAHFLVDAAAPLLIALGPKGS